MTMPLQDMIDSVLNDALQKVASAEPESVEEEVATVDLGGDTTHSAGVDPEYAEKLAGAVEYIAEHINSIETEQNEEVSDLRDALKNRLAVAKQPQDEPEAVTEKTSNTDRDALKRAILEKLGSGVDNPPKIANKGSSGPEGVYASEEGPGPKGPGGHELVGSVDKAIGYTKKDAKKGVKPDLGKVLDHTAFKDRTLQENLQNASKAGVKTAGARESLQKISAAGCVCESEGACAHCRLVVLTGKAVDMAPGGDDGKA